MLFGVFQVLGCLAKQYPDFRVLCFAHVSLGIATSLLYSSFESWMVVEHEKVRLSSCAFFNFEEVVFGCRHDFYDLRLRGFVLSQG